MDGKRIAIVIGSSEHEDSRLSFLESPAQDAMKLTQVLQNTKIGNYEVKLFLNAPSYNVNKAIESLFKDRKREDVLLLYFSGHGVLDDYGRLYFATTDTKPELLRSTAISASFVNEIMSNSRSRNQVMILDCCHSGAFNRGLTTDIGRGRVAITSSDALQFSLEKQTEEGLPNTGIFTNAMVKGLETGYADLNGDGQISVFELYNYVYQQLKKQETRQTPKFSAFDIEGDPIIAENCRKA